METVVKFCECYIFFALNKYLFIQLFVFLDLSLIQSWTIFYLIRIQLV